MLYDVEDGWRWMLGSSVIPCIIILIGRFDLPESPLWLIRKGRVKECEKMMEKLFGQPVVFEAEEQQKHISSNYSLSAIFLLFYPLPLFGPAK